MTRYGECECTLTTHVTRPGEFIHSTHVTRPSECTLTTYVIRSGELLTTHVTD